MPRPCQGEYADVAGMDRDMGVMFDNARRYNAEDSLVYLKVARFQMTNATSESSELDRRSFYFVLRDMYNILYGTIFAARIF